MKPDVSAKCKAEVGWHLIKTAIVEVLRLSPGGMRASEIGQMFGFHDSARAKHHGYVVWTALGHLMAEGLVEYDDTSKLYLLTSKAAL